MNQKKSKSIQSKSKDFSTLYIKQEAINNINFSVADEIYEKDLETREMYKQQRFENGFDDTETWHMDRTIALFIIPRLKKFIEINNGIPIGETVESYNEKLRFIISAFENYYATNKYHEGKPLTVVGDGSQLRDFTHISDVVEANILASEVTYGFGEVYNIGYGSNYSIIDIANMISNDVKFIPPRIGEVQETLASNEKFKGLTGWTPKVSLIEWLSK